MPDPFQDLPGESSQPGQYAASFQNNVNAYHDECGRDDEEDGKTGPDHCGLPVGSLERRGLSRSAV